MNIFLTGGTGFVGSHVLRQLLQDGHAVRALRRPGSEPRIALDRQPDWIEGALDDDLTPALTGMDVFVHLAAHTPNPPYDRLSRCLYWNVLAPVQLAEHAVAAGIRNFVIAGSFFEYGNAPPESVNATTPGNLRPENTYATSKAAASVAFEGFARHQKVRLKIMRLFQVYGEGEQATRLWPSLRDAALAGRDFPMTTGEQRRDFTPVELVAKRFSQALDFTSVLEGQPVTEHVATGQLTSVLEFATHWWQHWGATGRLLPGKIGPAPAVANVTDSGPVKFKSDQA